MLTQEQRLNVVDQLRNGEVTIDFTKADGSNRVMTATLANDLAASATFDVNADSLPVYETNVGWRSFSWNRLNSVDGVAV